MRTRLAIRIHAILERYFPERRLFLRSDTDTRFIRLKSETQFIAFTGSALVIAWSIIATAILLMDSIGAGNFREQARRDQQTYMSVSIRSARNATPAASDALAAQERFNSALERISLMQSELLGSEIRRRELETGIEVVQTTLRNVMSDKRAVETKFAALQDAMENGGPMPGHSDMADSETVDLLANALERTAQERDRVVADAQQALIAADAMATELRSMEEKNDAIFRQLEEAMTISVTPLDKMFKAAGMNPDNILDKVRAGYSGQGGPLMPLSFSTKGGELTEDSKRANRILNQMDRLNLYRIAAAKAPFANPLKDSYRFTSGFGYRWGRLHAGADFASAHGTPIYSTADGIVVHAGWQSGYGKLVKIQHEFGIETRYAHMSKIRVKKGQRVSRGDRIGDMGNTGRSTGTHLHYEVRVGGKAVNPMIYLKAAKDVF